MRLIIHKIRLLEPSFQEAFEDWVINTDYATCPHLPSVLAFSVQRADPGAGCDYFEVITVRSDADFQRDMNKAEFASLVARFSQMAEVVEEIGGLRLGAGYVQAQ